MRENVLHRLAFRIRPVRSSNSGSHLAAWSARETSSGITASRSFDARRVDATIDTSTCDHRRRVCPASRGSACAREKSNAPRAADRRHPSAAGPARWRARGACSHPACEHRVTRAARGGRSSSRRDRSPYVEQSFARVVSPSPSCCQESTWGEEAIPGCRGRAGRHADDVPSYLDFRPWGIFSTGTHAVARNLVTPPIEALVSTMPAHVCTYVRVYARDYVHTGCIAREAIPPEKRRTLEETRAWDKNWHSWFRRAVRI